MEGPLGRGLDSLIAKTFENEVGSAPADIPLDQVRPNPRQPRKSMDDNALEGLAASIREHGVLQPVVVRRTDDGYELVAGERRYRAAGKAGRTTIPAVIIDAKGIRSLELALIENIQRENLSPLDEAAAYEQLIVNTGLTHEELAARVGKSRATITNALRLLELPEDIKSLMNGGSLSAGQARAVLAAPSEEEARELARAAVEQRWTVRQVEHEVRARKAAPAKRRRTPSTGLKKRSRYEDQLRNLYGTRVTIVESPSGGEVRFRFYSDEDRDRLLHALLTGPGEG